MVIAEQALPLQQIVKNKEWFRLWKFWCGKKSTKHFPSWHCL